MKNVLLIFFCCAFVFQLFGEKYYLRDTAGINDMLKCQTLVSVESLLAEFFQASFLAASPFDIQAVGLGHI